MISTSVGGHRPAGEGLADAAGELLPIERLLRAVALDDHETHLLDALEGRVPAPARAALAPSTDGHAAFGGPGVDDAVVVRIAPRASHRDRCHKMLWRRERYRRPTSASTRGTTGHDERLMMATGSPGSARHRGRRPRPRSRRSISTTTARGRVRRDHRGDRPQRVAGSTTYVREGDGVSASATPSARADRARRAPSRGRRRPASTARRRRTYVRCMDPWWPNACSMSSVDSEHMFAPLRVGCYASRSSRGRLMTMSDTTASANASSASSTSSRRPSASGDTPRRSGRSARRSGSRRPPACTPSSRTSSARACCTRTRPSPGR